VRARILAVLYTLFAFLPLARAGAALFVEEPFGSFGGFNPTGHAAIYLSRVCAETPVKLRLCEPGESGVVISRYHRVGGYDWIAIPLIPYLYAVEHADEIPASANAEMVASLRDRYRRAHFADIVPDAEGAKMPGGDWIQLVGSAYDRTIYSLEIETSEAQDERLIEALNSRANSTHFNLLFHNCADFSRDVLDFYYPRAVHRGFLNDVGIMTPKQAARTLTKFSRKNRDLEFTSLEIPQVPGLPPSKPIRGVLESFVKSKKYVVPVAALHPLVIGGLAIYYITQSLFDENPMLAKEPTVKPDEIAVRLEAGGALRTLSYR